MLVMHTLESCKLLDLIVG